MGEVTEGDNGKVNGGGGGGGGGEGEVRVLVVDDSAVDRRIVEGLLKRSGTMFEVIAVDSGKKAMEILGLNEGKAESPTVNDKKIDIILTDYCMPEMTGYDLLKAVKEQSCPKSIPVVIMSSENEPQRINRCRAIGADDFILKPLQTKDVQKLRSYATSMALASKAGTKRKMPLDLMGENSGSERIPHLAGVAVA
ncbi:two-component response regulator ORR1-like isoform X2 [Phoenix dactylifera]|uniref:Two-component response regulator ORR1-like isoform X2 n=1 Tax=Phoenix dactylifera TaxID=42345 RepID=A0A8B9ATP5_PHODC|nr:two-component response regulator ORR1-like isoform X2 [Phoenix dactylifera]XP_038986734.1 two-component response regulator ORR1-like isoform X2 [Phoenix dactylifera]